MAAFQIEAVRLRIIRRSFGDARVVRIGELGPEAFGDRLRDRVFEVDDAGHLADVPISPDSVSPRGGDKLGGDVELFALHHDVANKHRMHPELQAGGSRVDRSSLVAKHRVPSDDSIDARETAQLGDDPFGETVAEVFHLLGAAGDLEGEHSDGAYRFAFGKIDW
jgi:hypothetical protein